MSFLLVFPLLLSEAVAANQSGHRLRKRFSGEATYYDVGLGACGGTNVASDFVVALNAAQFDEAGSGYPNPSCGKSLTITRNGKTANAIVVDKCPGCAYGDLDMSQGLFEYFESTSVGRFIISWNWGADVPVPVPAPTSTYVAPAPTTSAAPAPSPTATTTMTRSTDTQAAAQTTLSANSPSASASSSSSSTSSGNGSIASSSSDSAASSPTGHINPYGTGDDKSGLLGNVLVMQEAVVNLGSLILHAATQS